MQRDMNNQTFNIVIVGTGGQGLITLTRIISNVAMKEGLDVKTSELHGLSQRGGSVETHIRFGKEVHSPLVTQGGADLVISLELQETPRACYYANKEKTTFLVNNFIVPIVTDNKIVSIEHSPSEFNNFAKKTLFVPATKIVKERIGNPVLAGTFMISLAASKNLLPLKPSSLLGAIKEVVPEKYFGLNKKAFDLGQKYL